jgi:hypothetical protein
LSTILFFSIKKYFSALRKLKQKDHKFEGRLGYIYIYSKTMEGNKEGRKRGKEGGRK